MGQGNYFTTGENLILTTVHKITFISYVLSFFFLFDTCFEEKIRTEMIVVKFKNIFSLRYIFIAISLIFVYFELRGELHTQTQSHGKHRHIDKINVFKRQLNEVEIKTPTILQLSNNDYYVVENRSLFTTNYTTNKYSRQPYVSNGYIGSRVPIQGFGFAYDKEDDLTKSDINGWPLDNRRFTGSYLSGFWDYQRNISRTNFKELLKKGGESVISTIPAWTTLEIFDLKTNKSFNVNTSSNEIKYYRQELSLLDGILKTDVVWSPDEEKFKDYKIQISYQTFAHRSIPTLGVVNLNIKSSIPTSLKISNQLDISTCERTTLNEIGYELDSGIWIDVSPIGIPKTKARLFSTWTISDYSNIVKDRFSEHSPSIATGIVSEDIIIEIKNNNETVNINKFIGITSSDAFLQNYDVISKNTATDAFNEGILSLLEKHESEWKKLHSVDITIPDSKLLELSVHSTIYHLLSNIRSGNEISGIGDNSVTVGGLSSDSYGGLVFWDADTWIFPGLLSLYPDIAKNIINYRSKLHSQAIKNAIEYGFNGTSGDNDALYPWTSSRFGNCTSTGPCFDYQYHINTDIALSAWNYYKSTNDTEWLKSKGWPIIHDVANFFKDFVQFNETTQSYHTKNLTDPDEYANFINDGSFTNGAISELMEWVNEASIVLGYNNNKNYDYNKFKTISEKMYIPESEYDITVEFEGMNGTSPVKQADVVMLTYPVEFNQTNQRAINNLNYYSKHQSLDGPGMTYAIYSIDSSTLLNTGCSSYTYTLNSGLPYLRTPFMQFSEQLIDNYNDNGGTHPAFPFLTGNGGYLQIFTHGFTGFRAREFGLYFDPTIPVQLPNGYKINGFKYQGNEFDITINENNTIIEYIKTNLDNELPIIIEIGSRNEKNGFYSLKLGDKLIIPTFTTAQSIEGSLSECQSIISTTSKRENENSITYSELITDDSIAAIDGDNSTTWRTGSSSSVSNLIIDLGSEQFVSSIDVIWGDLPPLSASISFIDPIKIIDSTLKISSLFDFKNTSTTNDSLYTSIVSNDTVSISSPYDKKNDLIVNLQEPNSTTFNIGEGFKARFVKFDIYGSWNDDKDGASVAEIIIL